jgi:hypothetical protein
VWPLVKLAARKANEVLHVGILKIPGESISLQSGFCICRRVKTNFVEYATGVAIEYNQARFIIVDYYCPVLLQEIDDLEPRVTSQFR